MKILMALLLTTTVASAFNTQTPPPDDTSFGITCSVNPHKPERKPSYDLDVTYKNGSITSYGIWYAKNGTAFNRIDQYHDVEFRSQFGLAEWSGYRNGLKMTGTFYGTFAGGDYTEVVTRDDGKVITTVKIRCYHLE